MLDSPGLFASIVTAECIYKSDWGQKDIAKKDNNLFLLEKDEYYRGKSCDYDGKLYRTYDNWLDFAVDLGDYYIFTKKYNKVLQGKSLDVQLDALVKIQDYPKDYCMAIEELIRRYGLWEFDLY